jgi:hypothetical protein
MLSMSHLLEIIIAYGVCLFVVVLLFRPKRVDVVFLGFLLFFHFLFSAGFYYSTIGTITDSFNYFVWAGDYSDGNIVGTGFVVFLVRFIQSIVGVDYFSVLLVFSGFSALGSAGLYISLSKMCSVSGSTAATRQMLKFGMLLPGLHFWTSPIGKDSLILLIYGLLAIAIVRFKGLLWFSLLIAVLVSTMIRPHVGGCALIILMIYFIQNSIQKSRGIQRFGLVVVYGAIFAVIAAAVYLFLLQFVQKYSGSGYETLADFLSERQDVYASTGSGFDTSSVPFLVRYLLFLFGGIPWELGSILQIFAMVEGAFILALPVLLLRMIWRTRRFSKKISASLLPLRLRFGATYVFFYSLLLSAILTLGASNFGLIARQRIMVYVPLLFAFILMRIVLDKYTQKKLNTSIVL